MTWGFVAPLLVVVAVLTIVAGACALQRRTQRGVKAMTRLYGGTIDELPDRLVRWGVQDHRIRACNAAWAAEFGLTPDEATGRRMDELLRDVELEVFYDQARRMGPGWVGSSEAVRVGASGEVVREAWTDRVVTGAHGDLEVVSVGRDITRRAQAEEALARSEARQRAVVHSLHEGVLVFDEHGRCVEANAAAARILGVGAPEELLGQDASLLPLADAAGVPLAPDAHPVRHALAGNGSVEDRLVRHLARDRWMELDVLPVVDDASAAGSGRAGVVCSFADVTARVQAEGALAAREREYRTLVESVPVGIFRLDRSGNTTYVNPAWERLAGIPAAEAMGLGWRSAVHPDDLAPSGEDLDERVGSGRGGSGELRYRHADGTVVIAQVTIAELEGADGELSGFLGSVTDVTERVRLRQEIAESEARLRTLADGASDVVFRLGLSPLRFEYINDAVAVVTGRAPAEFYRDAEGVMASTLVDDDLAAVVADTWGDGSPTHVSRQRWRHADGTVRWMEVRVRVTMDGYGRPQTVDAIGRDITAMKESEAALHRLAHHDALTGLPNRRAVTVTLDEAGANREPVAVLFVDLDGFKSVNDRLGHAAGDDLLRLVAGRLTAATRVHDLVARFAGDEFVVVTSPAAAESLAERIVEQLGRPFMVGAGQEVVVSASVGVALAVPGEAGSQLLDRADRAMYEAKRDGKNRYRMDPPPR